MIDNNQNDLKIMNRNNPDYDHEQEYEQIHRRLRKLMAVFWVIVTVFGIFVAWQLLSMFAFSIAMSPTGSHSGLISFIFSLPAALFAMGLIPAIFIVIHKKRHNKNYRDLSNRKNAN